MLPYGMRDSFENYRKWFKSLLIKDFLNLPSKFQAQFIIMVEGFLADCKKVYLEGKVLKEKLMDLTIQDISTKDDCWMAYCKSPELNYKLSIKICKNYPQPEIGDRIRVTVFSVDEKTWYSSKEELIQKEYA